MPDLRQIPPEALPTLLPAWLGGFVAPSAASGVEAAIRLALAEADPSELTALLESVSQVGEGYRDWPPLPLARHLSRSFMAPLLEGSSVEGLDHLRGISGPCLLLGNHLSYVDTQVTDALLTVHGGVDLAQRLVVVAGPKVYETPFRRLAAACLHTLKTAQSTTIGHNPAALSPREVGRIALETIQQAHGLMGEGHLVLLYPEGTRSRAGALQPFVRATAKYLRLPGLSVVPLAQTGTQAVMPIDEERLHPAKVRLRFGAPIEVAPLGPQAALDLAWGHLDALISG